MFLMWSSDICRLVVCWRISGLLLRRTFGNHNIGIYWAWIGQIKVFEVCWACVVFVPLCVACSGCDIIAGRFSGVASDCDACCELACVQLLVFYGSSSIVGARASVNYARFLLLTSGGVRSSHVRIVMSVFHDPLCSHCDQTRRR